MNWIDNPTFFGLSLLVIAYSLVARISRWLSIWQQKEYRIDRLWAYLLSPEGRKEAQRLVNFPLNKAQFRRPRLTPKILLIAVTTLFLMLITPLNTLYDMIAWYLIIPFYIFIATTPFWMVTWIATKRFQKKAKAKILNHQPFIVGVTGSYGKTTTKILLGHVLKQKLSVWHTPKSFNNPLSLPQSIVKAYTGEPYVIIEYAAYKIGEIASLAKLFPPKLIIFTGINEQHLALFGSYENMQQAETELLTAGEKDIPVFYNSYDETVSSLANKFPDLRLYPAADIKLSKVQLSSDGEISFVWKGKRINTKLIGRHYLVNVRQVIHVASHLGLNPAQIKEGLESFVPTQEFVRTQRTKKNTLIIIDNKTSNPDGFKAMINLLKELKAKRKIMIASGIVDLGKVETTIHEELGQLLADAKIDLVHTSVVGESGFRRSLVNKSYTQALTPSQFQSSLDSQLTKDTVLVIEGNIGKINEDYLYSK